MILTPGPYLWRMRPEDEYRLVEVFHDNYGVTFRICGSNYNQLPTQGHEFIRLVSVEEVKLAYQEGFKQGLVRIGHTVQEINNGIRYWKNEYDDSRARRVASGEER